MSAHTRIGSVAETRGEMVRTARGIINDVIGIVSGSRELARLRFGSTTEYDRDVLIFVGIDSESDHFPLGDVRRHWSAEALKAKDAELLDYEARVRERAFQACESFILHYSKYDDVA